MFSTPPTKSSNINAKHGFKLTGSLFFCDIANAPLTLFNSDNFVANVSGTQISTTQFIRSLEMNIAQFAQMIGQELSGDQIMAFQIHQLVLQNLVNNAILGVNKGYEKTLELTGVGYRAAIKGKQLNLQLGFSHDINFDIPDDIKITVEKQTILKINGTDKQKVGMTASKIK